MPEAIGEGCEPVVSERIRECGVDESFGVGALAVGQGRLRDRETSTRGGDAERENKRACDEPEHEL